MSGSPHLAVMVAEIAALRFCPMYAPSDEVAGVTRLETHTTRARALQMWRIASGFQAWSPRDAEVMHESTLDSLSEAFDVWHAPVRRMMLAARRDIWSAGLAPACVVDAVRTLASGTPPEIGEADVVFVAGEIVQCRDTGAFLTPALGALAGSGRVAVAMATTGATAFALGATDVARNLAASLRTALVRSGAREIVADGPETLWAITRLWPDLGLDLPEGVRVRSLNEVLAPAPMPRGSIAGPVFVHDARAAYLLSEKRPEAVAVMPGYARQPGAREAACGGGSVFDLPRSLVAAAGLPMVWGQWVRGLARSSGADDGLQLTYPHLAARLARVRLAYAAGLGAATVVTDSPAAADWLARHRAADDPEVAWLAGGEGP